MLQNQPLQDAIRVIDEEILKLNESTRRLRSERNDIVPISQLPPELLARIFQFVADDESREPKPLERINFSHVSHHWRDVALGTPTLWRIISLGFPDCLPDMLQRSKMADLILYAGPSLKSPKYTQTIQLALSHMERVCEINICLSPNGSEALDRMNELLGHFLKSAPRLRALSITPSNSSLMSLPSLPPSSTPCLRQLVLMCRDFSDWDSKILTGLTYLKVHNISGRHSPSTHQVLDALRRLPALSYLDLSYVSVTLVGNTAYRGDPVNLAELKDLRLAGQPNDISFILAHVVINPSALIEINCVEKTGSRDRHVARPNVSRFFSSLSLFCNASEVPRPIYLNLETCHDKDGRIRLKLATYTTETSNLNSSTRSDRPQFSLNLCLNDVDVARAVDKADKLGYMFQKVVSLEQHASLRTLIWSSHGVIASDIMVDAFGCLPNIERISLSVDNRLPFINALMHKSSEYNSSPAACGPVILPRLHTLAFEGEALYPGTEDRALQSCLVERRERKAPLQKLIIPKPCWIMSNEDEALLREVVVNLEIKPFSAGRLSNVQTWKSAR